MMIEQGIVKKTIKDKALVEIVRSSACKKCGACQIDPEEKVVIAHATNSAGAKTGDTVEVELNFEAVMSASLIVYIIPLVAFFLGSLIGFYGIRIGAKGPENPVIALLTGLVFIAIAYLIIKVLDKKGRFGRKYNMKVVRIINSDEEQ